MTQVVSPDAAVLAAHAWLRGERTVANSDAIWGATAPAPRYQPSVAMTDRAARKILAAIHGLSESST